MAKILGPRGAFQLLQPVDVVGDDHHGIFGGEAHQLGQASRAWFFKREAHGHFFAKTGTSPH